MKIPEQKPEFYIYFFIFKQTSDNNLNTKQLNFAHIIFTTPHSLSIVVHIFKILPTYFISKDVYYTVYLPVDFLNSRNSRKRSIVDLNNSLFDFHKLCWLRNPIHYYILILTHLEILGRSLAGDFYEITLNLNEKSGISLHKSPIGDFFSTIP